MFKIKNIFTKTVDGGGKNTHEGHNSCIRCDEYEYTRTNKEVIRNNMRGFKSKNHEIVTYESNKISLCDFDDKRFILPNGIQTLPYCHKDIPTRT